MWNFLENLNSAVLQTVGGAVLLILFACLVGAGLLALLNDRRKL